MPREGPQPRPVAHNSGATGNEPATDALPRPALRLGRSASQGSSLGYSSGAAVPDTTRRLTRRRRSAITSSKRQTRTVRKGPLVPMTRNERTRGAEREPRPGSPVADARERTRRRHLRAVLALPTAVRRRCSVRTFWCRRAPALASRALVRTWPVVPGAVRQPHDGRPTSGRRTQSRILADSAIRAWAANCCCLAVRRGRTLGHDPDGAM